MKKIIKEKKSIKKKEKDLVVKNDEQEEKKKEKKILSPEEIEARIEKIRKSLPKINFHRDKIIRNPAKDKELCESLTTFSCIRPDIFLVNRDCDDCHYQKYCIAPCKIFSHEKRKRKRLN
jgi:hypothetical protein